MADAPHEILKRGLKAQGFKTLAEASRHFRWEQKMGLSEGAIRHHFNGHRRPDAAAAAQYSADLGVSKYELLGLDQDDTPAGTVPVEGRAKWGEWLDTDFFKSAASGDLKKARTISVPRGLGKDMRRAVVVADGSVDNRIREGDFAVYEPITADEVSDLTDGYLLIARRRGALEERTVRRVLGRAKDGKLLLGPDSSNTMYAGTVTFPSSRAGETVEILGKVVAQYGPI
jgi:hypothetical protein